MSNVPKYVEPPGLERRAYESLRSSNGARGTFTEEEIKREKRRLQRQDRAQEAEKLRRMKARYFGLE